MRSIQKTCQCGQTFTTYPSVNKEHCSQACSSRFKPRRTRAGQPATCEECSTVFYAAPSQVGRRRFCSRECQSRSASRKIRLACVICGTEFDKAPSNSIGRKYCSRACYESDRAPSKICKTCGVALKKSALTYCSQKCLHAGRRSGSERPCAICGVAMYVQPAETKQFCSLACKNESMRLKGPGARYVRPDGYVAVYYPSHPDAGGDRFVLEHRLVAEQKYGRRILRTEHVNHINGIRDDNRPENLEVVTPSAHAYISHEQRRQKKAARLAEAERIDADLAEYRRLYGPLPGK